MPLGKAGLRGYRKTAAMDTNGSGKLHEYGVPTFWATLAEK
ncbi:MAG: hypothetical protein ACOYID_07310 [Eubacteriales bacterium]